MERLNKNTVRKIVESRIIYQVIIGGKKYQGCCICDEYFKVTGFNQKYCLELSISVDQNKHKEIIPTKLQIIKMQYKKWQRRGATTTLTAALSGWMIGINVPLALINR